MKVEFNFSHYGTTIVTGLDFNPHLTNEVKNIQKRVGSTKEHYLKLYKKIFKIFSETSSRLLRPGLEPLRPHLIKDMQVLEKVQRRATRFFNEKNVNTSMGNSDHYLGQNRKFK